MVENSFSLIEVNPEQDIANCAVCFARNYDVTSPDAVGERVDRLYELHVGSMVMRLCDNCLDQLSGMLNYARQLRDHALRAGDEVFILERDEEGVACDVSGYMFLAEVGGRVIVTAYINNMDDLDGILEYHVEETAENYDTDLAVFPAEDCYATREAAHAALREEKGDDDDA